MRLGEPIKFRLTPDKHAQYEDEAARLDKPLGTYLRERLEADDVMRDELAAMRRELTSLHHRIEDLAGAGPPRHAAGDRGATALQIETLLMMRAIGGPDRIKTVQAELRRIGFDIWTHDGEGK